MHTHIFSMCLYGTAFTVNEFCVDFFVQYRKVHVRYCTVQYWHGTVRYGTVPIRYGMVRFGTVRYVRLGLKIFTFLMFIIPQSRKS